jgi:hypothetical protein
MFKYTFEDLIINRDQQDIDRIRKQIDDSLENEITCIFEPNVQKILREINNLIQDSIVRKEKYQTVYVNNINYEDLGMIRMYYNNCIIINTRPKNIFYNTSPKYIFNFNFN